MWPITTNRAAKKRRVFNPLKKTFGTASRAGGEGSIRVASRRLALGEHLGEVAADGLPLPGGEIPVDRPVEAVHELHLRLPAQELPGQAVAGHAVERSGGHVGEELDLGLVA